MKSNDYIFSAALEAIDGIYEKSKNPNKTGVDFFRIKDIINSVNENQLTGKQWLAEELIPFLNKDDKIFIAGPWYGLAALMICENFDTNLQIKLCDIDPLAEYFAKNFFCKNSKYPNISYLTGEALECYLEKYYMYDVVINTSCEHMEKYDVKLMASTKNKDSIIAFQSNNYHSVDSHINTSNSLEEFIEYLDLKEVLYSGVKKLESCDRYMVIGK